MIYIRSGGKARQRLWACWKKCCFRHSETIDLFQKKRLTFSGNFHWILDQLLQFTGNLLCQTRAVFSSFHMAMRFCKEQPVISKRFFALEFIQRHCQTLMLGISFGFTWLLTLAARLHGMADFDRHIASTLAWRRMCVFYKTCTSTGEVSPRWQKHIIYIYR